MSDENVYGDDLASLYQTVAASQTDAVIGRSARFIDSVVCVVSTAATAQTQIKDGSSGSNIIVLPNSPGGGVGTYTVRLGLRSRNADGWRVTTGAGVALIVKYRD